MMRYLADEWPKLLTGILVGAICFLTVLPSLGWAWHRVLPEHTHVILNPYQVTADTDSYAHSIIIHNPEICSDCATQISSGVIHLPGTVGWQVVGIALIVLTTLPWGCPVGFTYRVILQNNFYQSPLLANPNPPPINARSRA